VRRIKTDMVKNVHLCSRRVPVALGGNTKFLEIFSKNNRISNYIKIRPVGAELFHDDIRAMDRKTDKQTRRS